MLNDTLFNLGIVDGNREALSLLRNDWVVELATVYCDFSVFDAAFDHVLVEDLDNGTLQTGTGDSHAR